MTPIGKKGVRHLTGRHGNPSYKQRTYSFSYLNDTFTLAR
jgi:hypothetical protein